MPTIQCTQTVDIDNPVQNDLHLVNGTIALIDGRDEVAQAIRSRLLFFRGEWFLDPREGTPYYENILGQRARDLQVMRGIFRTVIQGTPGVAAVPVLNLSIDGNRQATLDFEAELTEGGIIRSRDFAPFIVEVG